MAWLIARVMPSGVCPIAWAHGPDRMTLSHGRMAPIAWAYGPSAWAYGRQYA